MQSIKFLRLILSSLSPHDTARSVHWIIVGSAKVLVIRTASSCITIEHHCLTYDGPWLSCLEQFEKIIVMPAKNELTVELSTLICHSDILHGPSPPCKQCHQFISQPSTWPDRGKNIQHSTFSLSKLLTFHTCVLFVLLLCNWDKENGLSRIMLSLSLDAIISINL